MAAQKLCNTASGSVFSPNTYGLGIFALQETLQPPSNERVEILLLQRYYPLQN